MIRSMTAYAQSSRQTDRGLLAWELRSVNHRYLDLSLRLPEAFRVLEPQIREAIKQALHRGKVEASLRFQADVAAESENLRLDPSLAKRLGDMLLELSQHARGGSDPDLVRLLHWPGLVVSESPDMEDERKTTLSLLDDALGRLVQGREQEGTAIAAMIEERLAGIEAQVAEVRQNVPEIRSALDRRLRERLATLEHPVDPGRIEQEVVLSLQKLDVDEELDRLGVHVAEIRRVLKLDEPVGRRLDFLMQELNREANTLGSKAAVVETGQAAVELKVLIEQMREQIQNVE